MQFDLGEDWFKNQKLLKKVLNKKFSSDDSLVFAEVGSWKGRSAIWFINNFLNNPSSYIYCIDTWDLNGWNDFNQEKTLLTTNIGRAKELKVDTIYDQFIFNIKHLGLINKVKILRQRSIEALMNLEDGKLDFIYIDGDHSEKGCYEDLNHAWPKIKKGGILFGDDWMWNDSGVYPVQQAVKQFADENGLKIKPYFFHGNGYYLEKIMD